jgi:hypothetical protein
VTSQHGELIAKLAVQNRLPSISGYRDFVESGRTGIIRNNLSDLSRQAASYVDRILKGEEPRDLPVQPPARYQFVLNLKSAKAIGLDVPANVLALTDEVIFRFSRAARQLHPNELTFPVTTMFVRVGPVRDIPTSFTGRKRACSEQSSRDWAE